MVINATPFLNDGLRFIQDSSQSTLFKIYNYTIASGSAYDDDLVQTLTGSSYISGLIFPIRGNQGSSEAMLLEQGKLLTQDKVIYTGSISLPGSGTIIGIGTEFYSIIPNGVTTYTVNGSIIYNKIYIRQSLNGSLW